jgi:hypothetical protein
VYECSKAGHLNAPPEGEKAASLERIVDHARERGLGNEVNLGTVYASR